MERWSLAPVPIVFSSIGRQNGKHPFSNILRIKLEKKPFQCVRIRSPFKIFFKCIQILKKKHASSFHEIMSFICYIMVKNANVKEKLLEHWANLPPPEFLNKPVKNSAKKVVNHLSNLGCSWSWPGICKVSRLESSLWTIAGGGL